MFIKVSVSTGKRAIDVSMEEEFWDALRDIAADRDTTLSTLIKEIVASVDGNSSGSRMASVFRAHVLEYYLNLPTKRRSTRRDTYRNTIRPQLH
jgi:predicted DNA-binding ribbon-helix-helix protein